MADITITIPTPVLVGSQTFKVEYSTDGVSYTLWSNTETNAPFTITGLTAGTKYWFRYTLILVASPLSACDPIVETYFIPAEVPCVTVAGEIVVSGDIYSLILTFTLPSPYVAPCGGYKLMYGISPSFNTIYFPTFVTSPSINPMTLPATNATYTVKIYSLGCNGEEILCDEITVDPPTDCEHATISSASITQSGTNYYLNITVVQSVPVTSAYQLSYHQANTVSSGIPDPGATVGLPTNGSPSQTFIVQVYPNTNVANNVISYVGVIIDRCKFSSYFDESIQIT